MSLLHDLRDARSLLPRKAPERSSFAPVLRMVISKGQLPLFLSYDYLCFSFASVIKARLDFHEVGRMIELQQPAIA